MSIAVLMRQMREAGAPMEAIEIAVAAIEAAQAKDAERKAKRAAQKAKERARKKEPVEGGEGDDSRATVARQGGDSRSDPAPKDITQTPTQSESEDARDPAEWPDDFREQAWQAYGQGREKKVSIQALVDLKRSGKVPWDQFLAGILRQAENVEPQFRPSLQRFIKREKWLDEYLDRPDGRQQSFRPVNGERAHVSPHRGSVAAELRAQIEADLLRTDEGEGVRAQPLRLVSHH
jgi:hypothetical protein